MRKIVLFGIAAMLVLAAVGAWTHTTANSPSEVAASLDSISPIEMMKKAKNLPVHQIIDAF